jgi:hypothetical protein
VPGRGSRGSHAEGPAKAGRLATASGCRRPRPSTNRDYIGVKRVDEFFQRASPTSDPSAKFANTLDRADGLHKATGVRQRIYLVRLEGTRNPAIDIRQGMGRSHTRSRRRRMADRNRTRFATDVIGRCHSTRPRHPRAPYSAVEVGKTLFSLPSGILCSLPPSFE